MKGHSEMWRTHQAENKVQNGGWGKTWGDGWASEPGEVFQTPVCTAEGTINSIAI